MEAFNGKDWQRDYYEHIACNEADRIARYIKSNFDRWNYDSENPSRK